MPLTSFILYSPQQSSHKQSRKTKIVLNIFFSRLGLIVAIKNIKQNIRENIVQCWFYETSIKIWA